MADLTMDRGLALWRGRAAVIEWLLAHKEVAALATIMLVAAALRLWSLESKALHHDESLHAQYTWYLYQGNGYAHDPMMHGPFKFHAGALVFFLFGDSDFTSRLLPALFGTALVGMPYLLRKQIGMTAVFVAAVLLTISPTLLYVSRFFRDDIYVTVWVFAIVICIWRYLDEQRDRYLYAMAVLLALSFATMEITFMYVAIFMLFLDLMFAVELGRRRADEVVDDMTVFLRTVALVPVAWLVAGGWPLLGQRPFGRESMPPVGNVFVLMGTLVLPQFAAGIQQLPFVPDHGYRAPEEQTLRDVTVLALLLLSAYAGLLWRPKVWLIAALAFYVPYVLLFTTFFTNTQGFWSGIWGSLDYWLDQHHVKRGNQPYYYYAMLTPLYEFLPLLLGLAGAAWLALRGDWLKRFLLFWLGGIFIGLSIAGEKMPWLEVHIALPLCLAAAVVLARLIDRSDLRERWQAVLALTVLAAAGGLALVEGSSALRAVGAALLVTTAGLAFVLQRRAGVSAAVRGLALVTVAVLAVLTLRAAITASYQHSDVPVEMLVYTQSSRDIPRLRDRIDALARESGLGRNLPIVVDPTDGFAWPWAWYLRDYLNVSYTSPSAGFEPPPGAVLLVAQANAPFVDSRGYSQTPYKHRWWFCESYRDPGGNCITDGSLSPGQIVAKLTDPGTLRSLGSFFLYRRSQAHTGSVNSVAFFPESLAAFDPAAAPGRSPAQPRLLADGRIVIGQLGIAPGELARPAGVFVDGQGNIWVADSRNGRVQKYDAQGNYLGRLGRAGNAQGAFNEPWSLAVDAEGFVYVADTWNHRIQKFSPQLEFVTSWGRPGSGPSPGPLDLYGPRDVAIAPDGSIWITDTGHKRLIRYSKDGEPLGVFGREGSAPGQFSEPVGLEFDAAGRLFVADAWNGRIQRFEPSMAESLSIQTGWTSREVLDKPYLAVLADGRLIASDPARGALLLFDAEGRPAGTWRPAEGAKPAGVAALADGGFVFSDIERHEVEVVPAALIDQLFR